MLKLRLEPQTALLLLLGIIFGSLINIPVKRIGRNEERLFHPFALFGLMGYFPQLQSVQKVTVVAVNVSGCVIPVGIALYESHFIISKSIGAPFFLTIAVLI